MVTNPAPTASLLPDPIAICSRIKWLNHEIRLSRRLLRLSLQAREHGQQASKTTHPSEAAHAPGR